MQDYSEGILLDANENSIGPSIQGHEHLQLNRLFLILCRSICNFLIFKYDSVRVWDSSDNCIFSKQFFTTCMKK